MKSWGTDVIPESKWIDVSQEYRTRDGKRVINLQKVLKNSSGNEVTYPIKGSIVLRENPLKLKYFIWSLDGRANVVWDNNKNLDLIKVN